MTTSRSRETLFIADGHHRYETALAYQAEVRADARWTDAPAGALEADWIMCVLVNAELEELEIRATHRLLTDADPAELRALVDGTDAAVHPTPLLAEALPEAVAAAETPAFGLVTNEGGWLLRVDPDAAAE